MGIGACLTRSRQEDAVAEPSCHRVAVDCLWIHARPRDQGAGGVLLPPQPDAFRHRHVRLQAARLARKNP